MLKSLQLKNFRGFKDHRVDFQKLTLLVGSNNAGKTTIIEALRIVSIAQSKAKKPVFVPAPEWLVEHSPGAGFRLKLDAIGFEHRYAHFVAQDDEPAQIIAKLSNNNIIVVSIGPDEGDVFCQLKLAGSKSVVLRSDPALGRF
ncbi:MAG: AAA family ATPase, partial [Alphaproteobacteria bacterium]|nr:AAA family ATPase [Alphaproteobacteria bacterium]